jgi:hypothetical protein
MRYASLYNHLLKIAAVLTLAIATQLRATEANTWLPEQPQEIKAKSGIRISDEKYFEVSASKLETAEDFLAKESVFPEREPVDNWGSTGFKCGDGEKPYLVRALYGNGATGGYVVLWKDDALVVGHASLGPSNPPTRSALIVCLSHAPAKIYGSVSFAR